MQIVNDDNFDTEVLDYTGNVLVYFGAGWCGPCKKQAPILEQWSEKNPSVKIVKVDIDSSPQTTKEHGIRSIPTIIAFKDGKELKSKSGLIMADQITSLME